VEYRLILICAVTCAVALAAECGESRTFDLSPRWDAAVPLANPHKGWYHHYFDNGIAKYLPRRDEELIEFPGMDHIYLRLAWAYLEPREGRHDWKVIDDVIAKWTAKGLKVAFRISCRETGSYRVEQQFATPKWVMEAGAKGGFYSRHKKPGNPKFPWEPVYDDPVFLAKLEHFLRAFAKRYDGKPWLRYVDVGSLGDWGEGHTSSGSGKKYGWAARLKHLEIHTRHFKKTLVVVSDDFVQTAPTADGRKRLHRYIVDHDMSYRDDSILVDYWTRRDGKTWSVSAPELFEAVWRKRPTVLECQHLRLYADPDKWHGRPGSTTGRFNATAPDFIRGAIRTMHATYIGYHGPIHQWLALPGNPRLTAELLNLCGYWYFPHRVTVPAAPGNRGESTISVTWENRGVAPAYHPYKLLFRLRGPARRTVAVDARNMRWLPGKAGRTYTEPYRAAFFTGLKPGTYGLAIKLHSDQANRPVLLPLRAALREKDGFYSVGTVRVGAGDGG